MSLLHRMTGWRIEWLAFSVLASCLGTAHGAGLGRVQVHSALGEPLRASVPLLGNDTATYDVPCISARVLSLDGSLAIVPTVRILRADNTNAIILTTREPLNEPALNILVETSCNANVKREYQVLLDPVPLHLSPATALAQAPVSPSAHDASPSRPAKSADTLTQRPRSKRKTQAATASTNAVTPSRHKESDATSRSVLKMTRADVLVEQTPMVTRLKASDALAEMEREERDKQEQARHAETLALIEALREQTQALRTETERMKQLYARDRNEAEAARDESTTWIRALVALLTVCAGAIIWLLWRMQAMKKNSAQVSWNELFSDTTSATQLGASSEFGTTAFQITSLDTKDLEPTEHLNGDHPITLIGETKPAAVTGYVNTETAFHLYGTRHGGTPEHALKAEEISDVMELAEAWMAMHDPAAVARLLEPFGEAEHPQSPLPLLCLLDVYRSLGEREKFDAIRDRIKKIFNVKLATWEMPPDMPAPRSLVDYEHVRERILDLWGTDDLVPYLDSLVADERRGLREGFDLPAYRDILRLKTIAASRASGTALDPRAYAILFTPPQSEDVHVEPADMTLDYPLIAGGKRFIAPHTTDEPARAVGSVDELALCEPEREIGRTKEKATESSSPEWETLDPAMRENMSPMSIKLHLAVAYRDIGDKEGACLLLEEVIQDGSEEQVAEARKMLETLA